jgi:uncharacterized protein YciI
VSGFDFTAMQTRGNTAGVSPLYVMMMTPLPQPQDVRADSAPGTPSPLEAHYAYMHELLEQGKVQLIGPCMGEQARPGHAPVPPGIGILNVASRAQAEEIACNEPFHAMGWRHNAVMEWTPKFGSLIEMLRDIAPTGR